MVDFPGSLFDFSGRYLPNSKQFEGLTSSSGVNSCCSSKNSGAKKQKDPMNNYDLLLFLG